MTSVFALDTLNGSRGLDFGQRSLCKAVYFRKSFPLFNLRWLWAVFWLSPEVFIYIKDIVRFISSRDRKNASYLRFIVL